MTRIKRQKYDAARVLATMGIAPEHGEALLRIERKLHRWHELECGIDVPHGHMQAISRDEETGKLTWYDGRDWRAYRGPDYETLALERLKKIAAAYLLDYYVQTDPRGCALYILRPGDVPAGMTADSCYSRGIAVYRE